MEERWKKNVINETCHVNKHCPWLRLNNTAKMKELFPSLGYKAGNWVEPPVSLWLLCNFLRCHCESEFLNIFFQRLILYLACLECLTESNPMCFKTLPWHRRWAFSFRLERKSMNLSSAAITPQPRVPKLAGKQHQSSIFSPPRDGPVRAAEVWSGLFMQERIVCHWMTARTQCHSFAAWSF